MGILNTLVALARASGVSSWSALTDKTTAPVATENTSVANALASKTTSGLVTRTPTDITASRTLTSADFAATSITDINSAAVVTITVPAVSGLGLPATPGQKRVIGFRVTGGGIPVFTPAAGVVLTNISGTVVTGSFLMLSQDTVGGDNFTVS